MIQEGGNMLHSIHYVTLSIVYTDMQYRPVQTTVHYG